MNENGIPGDPSPADPGFLDQLEAFLEDWAGQIQGQEPEPEAQREAILDEICDAISIIVDELITQAGAGGEPSGKTSEADEN